MTFILHFVFKAHGRPRTKNPCLFRSHFSHKRGLVLVLSHGTNRNKAQVSINDSTVLEGYGVKSPHVKF